MAVLARAREMGEMDRVAIQERGIPSLVLMERAAQGLLAAVEKLAPAGPGRCAVLVGPGNNGGDGITVARLLLERGWQVRCLLAGRRDKLSPDFSAMAQRLEEAGGNVEDFVPGDGEAERFVLNCDVIVDALFGVGLNSPLRQPAAQAVELINRSPAPVVSADIPSGVEADSGRVLGCGVKAAVTVTFSLGKPGLYVGQGGVCAGNVVVWDIGIPRDILEGGRADTLLFEYDLVASWLPCRPVDAHKGVFGRTLIVGGSVGFTGDPVLASLACLRSGGGLVTIATPRDAYPVVAAHCLEAMARPLPETGEELAQLAGGCDALLLGPGMGRGMDERAMELLSGYPGPAGVDADGINALSQHMDVLEGRRGRVTILTPHDGEFARLGGVLEDGDRLAQARGFAQKWGCILVLKGKGTIIALPDGTCYVNPTGNQGMAKGGSGDLLGGMILSLVGQGMEPGLAAAGGVYLHGRAGDLAAEELGERGMLPRDLARHIPAAFRSLG